jgi:Holliday junction resolvase RusA-like endonuclease
MTQRGKFVKPQAQRYLEYKSFAGWCAKSHFTKPIQKGKSVRVKINFFLCGGQTPDIDNLIKSILDSLNNIAWEDDKQVVSVEAERRKANCKGDEKSEVWVESL